MKIDVKVKDTISSDLAKKVREFERLPKEAHKEFVALTPIDQGNARRNTRLQGNTITANYPYAQRLDQGWSKQAPNGMLEPFMKWYEKRLKQIAEK